MTAQLIEPNELMPVTALTLADRLVIRTRKMPSGCIEWQGSVNTSGYGHIRERCNGASKLHIASRLAFSLFVGEIPQGLQALHRCDNRRCVNPVHIFLGTNQDNVDDKVAKGRARGGDTRGERHGALKLTDAKVREIRALYSAGHFQKDIAARFKVHQVLVSLIIRRKRWAHVA